MISRATSMVIASAYNERFTYVSRHSGRGSVDKVYYNELYDFLYENEYEAWLCNLAKANLYVRTQKEWFLKIHTGESLVKATESWSWEQRQKLGQRLLKDLAKDHLIWYKQFEHDAFHKTTYGETANELLRRLELDGYIFKDNQLFQQQEDILDVEQEKGALQVLFKSSRLARTNDAFEFLRISEEHFIAGRWSDCISNVRKFFELTLSEGARSLSKTLGSTLSEDTLARPVEVRQYLERQGLFERKERESLDKIYGLLSETGAHPYMAESDQARLLRQLCLTITQFALLRLSSALQLQK